MIIVPKEKPYKEKLNTYYLHIRKLLEHCQGEFGSGGIHFQSGASEGIIFFDKDDLLNGVVKNSRGETEGRAAVDHLLEEAALDHFQVDVYQISPENIYYWANSPSAKELYRGLSTEFTDIEGLVKKMASEEFTGFISISIADGNESGVLFFMNGKITGSSYSWGHDVLNGTEEGSELLIQKTAESGGTFDVYEISLTKPNPQTGKRGTVSKPSSQNLTLLEELLSLLKKSVASDKKIKVPFNKLLKKKFLDKANRYPFLDPFAAEFKYVNQEITYVGDASEEDLAKGVIESVTELAEELGLLPQMQAKFKQLSEKYPLSSLLPL